jgi:hypothetical protein
LANGKEKPDLRRKMLLLRWDVLRRLQRVPDAPPDYSRASTVSIEFGATNREQGLYVFDVGNSKHTVTTRDGEEAWLFAPGVNYSYVYVDPTFKWVLSNAVVRMEYQIDTGSPIALHYDGRKGTYSSPGYGLDKGQTGQWQVIEFAFHDTLFQDARGDGADFRIHSNGSGFCLRHITVSHYQRGQIPRPSGFHKFQSIGFDLLLQFRHPLLSSCTGSCGVH